MKTRIVRIGKSHGVRIPKALLEETGLAGEVEISVDAGALVVGPVAKPRAGWSAAFARMARHGDDEPLDGNLPTLTSWDEAEWEW